MGKNTNESLGVLADFSLPSEPGNERQAMERVAAVIQNLNLPSQTIERLKTAVAEATMNAMEHGNQYDPNLPVDIRVVMNEDALSISITDHGNEAVKEGSEPPDLAAKLAGEQSPRGWGLFLIKNMVDELNFISGEDYHTIELVLRARTTSQKG